MCFYSDHVFGIFGKLSHCNVSHIVMTPYARALFASVSMFLVMSMYFIYFYQTSITNKMVGGYHENNSKFKKSLKIPKG